MKTILGYQMTTTNGETGKVKDLLLDEATWQVRYAEVEFGPLFSKRRMLVPREKLGKPDADYLTIPAMMSTDELADCPPLEENLPVSRVYEHKLNEHLQLINYWDQYYTTPTAIPGITHSIQIKAKPSPGDVVDPSEINTSLRSLRELQDYHVKTLDGELGHLEDLLMDDGNWSIPFLVVDTHNWIPWSRKVLLRIAWVDSFSYTEREVHVLLTTDMVKASPTYDSSMPVNEVYEKHYYDMKGRKVK